MELISLTYFINLLQAIFKKKPLSNLSRLSELNLNSTVPCLGYLLVVLLSICTCMSSMLLLLPSELAVNIDYAIVARKLLSATATSTAAGC